MSSEPPATGVALLASSDSSVTRMINRFHRDVALALLGPATEEFADLGDDAGLAYLLSQLARVQMLLQVDFPAAISNADRALAIAEHVDRVDLVADTLVTRGTALVSLGRGYEGIGCLESALRLAERHGLIWTEIRARLNMGGPLADEDPRACFDVSSVGLELARRFGYRMSVALLTGNASVGAVGCGEWTWAEEAVEQGLQEAASIEARMTLLGFKIELMVERGEPADAELEESVAWVTAEIVREPALESALISLRAQRAQQAGDLPEAARLMIENGRLDRYNAVWSYDRAIEAALVAHDIDLCVEALDALRATDSHAALAKLGVRVGEAGIDALEGRVDTARGAFLSCFAAYADLGARRKQAMTGLIMATLFGDRDPAVNAAIDESRRLFQAMGAGLWLAKLDAALTSAAQAPEAAKPPTDAANASKAASMVD